MKTLFALILAFAQAAHAQLVVSWVGGSDVSVGPGTTAFDFTEGAISQTVRGLGVWDASGTGLSDSHQVGLWDFTTRALLASVTVAPTTAIAINSFWYEPITPLTLQANHHYMLGAFYADNSFDLAHANATGTVLVNATLGDAWLSTASTFTFPDLNVSGADQGFFGANISFAPVPEPGLAALLTALALLGLAGTRTTIRTLLDAKPADRQKIAAAMPKAQRHVVESAVPAENRPPVTPGSTHGNRPVVPPGLANYGSP